MAKKKNNGLIVLAVIAGFLILSQGGKLSAPIQAITGSETIVINAPSQVNPGASFQVGYEAVGVSGVWGASVETSIDGGCTINGQTSLKVPLVSDLPNPIIYTAQAPQSGTCTITGDYKFGEFPIALMDPVDINICQSVCTRPADLCIQSSTHSDGCGGFCSGSWTVQQLTVADDNCDNIINRGELGTAITMWIEGSMSRDDLGIAIMSWVAGG